MIRSRGWYALAGLGLLFAFFIFAMIGGYADEAGVTWLSNLMVACGGGCAGLGLLFLGRAAFTGRLRRSMFRNPPADLLDQDKRH